jgi:hypothetical protein
MAKGSIGLISGASLISQKQMQCGDRNSASGIFSLTEGGILGYR